jgi:hypothetical protein
VIKVIEIICAAIAAIATIVAASIGLHVKHTNAQMEHKAALRQKESLLCLRMIDATLQLSVVSSNALTGGHNNGNVERARLAAQKAAADYEDFMRDLTSHEINK